MTEHNTTADELYWLYVPELSEAAQEAFEQIEAVMPKVRDHVNAERLAQLPNFQSKLKIRRLRQTDLRKIGVRYVRNGDWLVMPLLLSVNVN